MRKKYFKGKGMRASVTDPDAGLVQEELMLTSVLTQLNQHSEKLYADEKIVSCMEILERNIQTKKKKPLQDLSNLNNKELSGQEKQMKDAKHRFQALLIEELEQPYVFRDKSLVLAENLLLFNCLYEQLWHKLGVISSAINMVRIGLHAEDSMSHLPYNQIVRTPE